MVSFARLKPFFVRLAWFFKASRKERIIYMTGQRNLVVTGAIGDAKQYLLFKIWYLRKKLENAKGKKETNDLHLVIQHDT